MRNRLIRLVIALAAVWMLASAAPAQTGQSTGAAKAKPAPPPAPPHELTGVWEFARVPNQAPHTTPGLNPPPMTPWAQARFDAAKPGYGPRAAPGGNDPILQCDPLGMPRVLFWDSIIEFLQTPGRMLQFFEAQHVWRDIWTDGRKLPQDDPDSSWYGDSIGRWEGDTFVVETVGVNDTQWLDWYGHPHSEDMHLTERYQRPDRDHMTFSETIDDPKAFTTPWVGVPRYYELRPKTQITQVFCAPSEENAFTKRIREPAAAPGGDQRARDAGGHLR